MAIHFFTDWYWTLSILTSLCFVYLWEGFGTFCLKDKKEVNQSDLSLFQTAVLSLTVTSSPALLRVITSMKYWAQQGFNKWQPLLWWSLLHNFSFGNSLFLVFHNNEIIRHSFAIILFPFTSLPSLKITHLIRLLPNIYSNISFLLTCLNDMPLHSLISLFSN